MKFFKTISATSFLSPLSISEVVGVLGFMELILSAQEYGLGKFNWLFSRKPKNPI
jgi:hypothetical protein